MKEITFRCNPLEPITKTKIKIQWLWILLGVGLLALLLITAANESRSDNKSAAISSEHEPTNEGKS